MVLPFDDQSVFVLGGVRAFKQTRQYKEYETTDRDCIRYVPDSLHAIKDSTLERTFKPEHHIFPNVLAHPCTHSVEVVREVEVASNSKGVLLPGALTLYGTV